MLENLLISLEITVKGMIGIFAAVLLIMLVVWILGKLSKKQK